MERRRHPPAALWQPAIACAVVPLERFLRHAVEGKGGPTVLSRRGAVMPQGHAEQHQPLRSSPSIQIKRSLHCISFRWISTDSGLADPQFAAFLACSASHVWVPGTRTVRPTTVRDFGQSCRSPPVDESRISRFGSESVRARTYSPTHSSICHEPFQARSGEGRCRKRRSSRRSPGCSPAALWCWRR